MIHRQGDQQYVPALDGIERSTLAHGERTMMTQFRLAAGSHLPRHSHPHEQTGYLLSGRLRFTVGEESHELGPGDSWCIPGGVEHSVDAFEASVVLEVFSPPRDEYR